MTKYSDHFTAEELQCPTSKQVILEPGFIDDLEELRVAYGKGMAVTSGCRSTAHNDWLQSRGYPASENSFHLINNPKYGTDCCAVDVARPAGPDLRKLLAAALERGWSVGLAKTFVHLDMRGKYARVQSTVYTY
jgi:uncharacterized protein YcbK (DUF882 family)